jgi:hypothetical protein
LTENEDRAFEAIIGYGWKPFAEFFYKHLGRHYLEKYEKEAINLFEQRSQINYQLYNIEKAKRGHKEYKVKPWNGV